MTNSEAYRILTRELTNMYADERTAFDNSGWRYDTALSLVKAGKNEDAVDLVLIFVTDRGQAWRMKQDLRFINA